LSRKCAKSEHDEAASLVCCDGGVAYFEDVSWSYSDQWVCGNLKIGDKCSGDLACESNICLNSECVAERVPDLQPCEYDSHCLSRKCAKSEHDEAASLVCCDGGVAYFEDVSWSYSDQWVCGNLKIGDKCSGDLACESNICLNGECVAERVPDLLSCEYDSHCLSGKCALQELDEFAQRVCCVGGAVTLVDVPWSYSKQWVCGALGIGDKCWGGLACESNICMDGVCVSERMANLSPCQFDSHCLSGSCAKNEMTQNAPLVCCPGGDVTMRDVSWSYRDERFCIDAGVNELSAGQLCSGNNDCASHVCTFGVCSMRVADLQPCEQVNDCTNRVACAKSSFADNAPSICCEDGEAYKLDVSWSYTDYWFCGNRPVGTACGDDRMCASGICVAGSCASARLADGESCQESSDCTNRVACAKSSFADNAPSICCEDGEAYKLDVSWSYTDYWFCGNLAVGTECGDDRMCSSGICIARVCENERLKDGEPCQGNFDCINGACAKVEFAENAPLVCCSGGEFHLVDVPWSYRDERICGNLATGSTCGTDLMCRRKKCLTSGSCM